LAAFNLNEATSISNKVVIVTGANSGIGFEIAKTISSKGAKVIIACRDESKGLATQEQISGNAEYINLDLRSFASIEHFCESVKTKHPKVDVLINNAGVMHPPFTKTNEQLELTFGVNYIGYYLLTNKIMPLLRDVRESRVVNMSSIAQYRVSNIDWDNINSERHYNKRESYDLSNLFRIMFTLALEERLRQKHYETIAVSCHPGVTLTNLSRFMPKILGNTMLTRIMNTLVFHTPYKAAMPALMAATSSNVKGGEFVGLDTTKQYRGSPKVVEPNQLAHDKSLRDTLWRKSVEITGVDLE
jgi:NAD(P)-dependent dehydrogenase (short-subunit alcohol dehydrogenase family)